MRTITRINSRLHGDWGNRGTRKYRVLEEYPRYYLCECLYNGRPLYRECFLKVDVDGVRAVPVEREKYKGTGWHM